MHTLKNGDKAPLEDDDIELGGERSVFRLKTLKLDEKKSDKLKEHPVMNALLSNVTANIDSNESIYKYVSLSPVISDERFPPHWHRSLHDT